MKAKFSTVVRAVRRGFTLIELMIVVVIMGVLAALAVYSVTNYITYTKTSEANDLVGDIMAGQEAYASEVGAYLNVTGGLGNTNFYPLNDFNGTVLVQWGADTGCTGCQANFARIGVNVPQPVRFRYASTTLAQGATARYGGRANSCENAAQPETRPGYSVVAVSDLDGDGGLMSVVVGGRMQSNLCTVNLGQ